MRAIGTLAAVLFLLVGCASIPPEAPALSVELGKRISAIEEAHITLVQRFFDQKRADLDRFIEDEWVPAFADQFFSNPRIAESWDTIVRENDKRQRLFFLIKTGPRLQKAINEKRLELVQPLDDLQRRIENKIRSEYDQARAINNALTSYLSSASKVAENRDRYLALVGVSEERVGQWIDQTDDAVADLMGSVQRGQDKVDRGKAFVEQIRAIRDSI